MKFDIFKIVKHIPQTKIRQKVLDYTFSWAIPFNKGLGLKLSSVTPEKVEVISRPLRKRQNHVGGAHACFLALMGEYAAGLCLAQTYSAENYRMIIGSLKVEYLKQGRGSLLSIAKRPKELPQQTSDEFWVPMKTEIMNEQNELIAICETNWQIKAWNKVRSKN